MRKLKSPIRHRHRIVLLFGLGIVLPSLLLGYLAFRGVQNDRALLEKERLEAIRRSVDRVLRAVDEGIAAVESELAKIVAADPGGESPAVADALEDLAVRRPLVEQVFYLQDLEAVHIPNAKLLYVPDGRRETGASSGLGPSGPAGIQNGQRLEFREKNYPRALAVYKQALGQSSDPRQTGIILNAIARVQRRSGLLQEAAASYERIVSDHGETVLPGGMPLGPSAALEICAIAHELGKIERSLAASIGFYRFLVRRKWLLEKAEYNFFRERAKGLIEELSAGRPPGLDPAPFRDELEALEEEEAAARRSTEKMIAFGSGALPGLEAGIKTVESPDSSNALFSRLTMNIGANTYLVSIQRRRKPADRAPGRIWGTIIDAGRLREDLLLPALHEHVLSDGTSWAVKGRDGAVLLTSGDRPQGQPVLRTGFAAGFPDWSLEFHQAPPHAVKTFLLSRRGLYSFVFLLIAGILIFGLALTIRSVSHELELARMKSDFVSTVSHEFKSPLTSIRQLAEMLQSGRVPSEERRQKYYDVLLEQSERLALLTDNILSLAKIEEGRAEFSFEATEISELLTEIVASIQERVRHEGFDIGLEVKGTLPPLAVDRAALSQAVTNLVDNAVKYSGDSRTIAVGAAAEERSLEISVRDFGVGIKKEDLNRVFERFYRGGDELTRTVKGSGLGLTLVKRIVEAHRGEIQVESESGKGSVFTIRLPLP
jgi:signal transduction histidine kinase